MTNIVNLNAERKLKAVKHNRDDYGQYLKLLNPSALAHEAKYLAKEVKLYGASHGIVGKAQAVIAELTDRIEDNPFPRNGSLPQEPLKVLHNRFGQTLKDE